MTPVMVERAQAIAAGRGISNVSFILAPIEHIPLPDASADAVVSNCVINLSPVKLDVFREALRILKPRGRLVISDVVQERPLGPIGDDCGCVATAMVRGEYFEMIRFAGLTELRVVEDRPWRFGPGGPEASAVTVIARKPNHEKTS